MSKLYTDESRIYFIYYCDYDDVIDTIYTDPDKPFKGILNCQLCDLPMRKIGWNPEL